MPPRPSARRNARGGTATASRRVKKAATPEESDEDMGAGRAEEQKEDEDEEDEDDNGPVASGSGNTSNYVKFSKQTFVNQPIDVAYEKLLKAAGANWANPAKAIKDPGMSMLADTARALEDAGGDEELLVKLDDAMRRMIDASTNVKVHQQAIDGLRQRLLRKEEISDLLNVYNARVIEANEEYSKKTPRQKYAKDESYTSFRNGVWEGQHANDKKSEAMPPDFIFETLPREEGDEGEESDDDIVLGGQKQDLKCPITLRYLVDPLTSKKCGHSYSRQGITDYLKGHTTNACPSSGCDAHISKSDLEENPALARAAKRAQRAEEDMDDVDEEGEVDLDD